MTALILMTAMPPTIGHEYLIDWAETFIHSINPYHGWPYVHVVVGTQPHEPMCEERYEALSAHFSESEVYVSHLHQVLPQKPDPRYGVNDLNFWSKWKVALKAQMYEHAKYTHLISSEEYGPRLAKELGLIHVPYDTDRAIVDAKGTKVRNKEQGLQYVIPEFQKYLRKKIVLFGADSCGKSTLTKALGRAHKSPAVPEWARTYLESLGSPEVTVDHMETIVHGQAASQSVANHPGRHPFVFFDTDTLTTIGYYRLYIKDYQNDPGYQRALEIMRWWKPDLYLVCDTNIPFEPDPLRYGDGKRESDTAFWIDLLEEFKRPYRLLSHSDRGWRQMEASSIVTDLYNSSPIWNYKRD